MKCSKCSITLFAVSSAFGGLAGNVFSEPKAILRAHSDNANVMILQA